MPTPVFLFGAGQLAAWEGGESKTGVVKAVSNTGQFNLVVDWAVDPTWSIIRDFYGSQTYNSKARHITGRTLEFTSGVQDGTKFVIDKNIWSQPLLEVLIQAAPGTTITPLPSAGDTFTVHPSGITDDSQPTGISDSTDWHNILTWNNDSSDGKQYRLKVLDQTGADIADGIPVPAQDNLHIHELVVQVSLAYPLGNLTHHLTHQLQKYRNVTMPYVTASSAVPRVTGTIFEDAMGYLEWRILVEGSVYKNYTGMNPRSTLTVPADRIDPVDWIRQYASPSGNMASFRPFSDYLGFAREHTYTNMLFRPIDVDAGQTFVVQARCTVNNVVVEYDCWARGQYLG